MKLTAIRRTGLVPVKATKDTGTHLKGAIFGLPPAIAAKAITAKDVEAVEPGADVETDEVTVDEDGAVSVTASGDKPTDEPGGGGGKSGDGETGKTSGDSQPPVQQPTAPATLKQPAKAPGA